MINTTMFYREAAQKGQRALKRDKSEKVVTLAKGKILRLSNGGENKNNTNAISQVGFICKQLLNDLKLFQFPLKPEQPGHSGSIFLEVVYI